MTDRAADARRLFAPEPGTIYLDAATYGLPPQPTVDALPARRVWPGADADRPDRGGGRDLRGRSPSRSGRSNRCACSSSGRPRGLFEDVLRLARSLADQVGVPWGGATLVNVPVRDLESAQRAVQEAGIRVSVRGGGLRLSPHVWNTAAHHLDRAVEVVGPLVAR